MRADRPRRAENGQGPRVPYTAMRNAWAPLAVLTALSSPALAEGVDLGDGLLAVEVQPGQGDRHFYHLASSALQLQQDGFVACGQPATGAVACGVSGTGTAAGMPLRPGDFYCGVGGIGTAEQFSAGCSNGSFLRAGPIQEGLSRCHVFGPVPSATCWAYAVHQDLGGVFCIDSAGTGPSSGGAGGLCYLWAETPVGQVIVICNGLGLASQGSVLVALGSANCFLYRHPLAGPRQPFLAAGASVDTRPVGQAYACAVGDGGTVPAGLCLAAAAWNENACMVLTDGRQDLLRYCAA